MCHATNQMSRAIALFNQAGGVGKTTITQNLGYQLSTRGHKVLLIDLDPQASLTTFMGVDPDTLDKTLFDSLVNEEPLFILPSLHGMALAPTNITLSAAEVQLVNLDFREVRLSEALDPIRNDYDFILIDCPPSLGLLSYSALVGSHSRSRSDRDTLQSFPGNQLTLANGG
jgi:chromosome partitioning protein